MRLVDGPIHLALAAHEVALRQLRAASNYTQLAARYAVDGIIVVPAKHMIILQAVERGLVLTTTHVLAIPTHLCIDSEGSTDALMPLAVDRFGDAFAEYGSYSIGSLLLVLPSAFSGGELTIAFDDNCAAPPSDISNMQASKERKGKARAEQKATETPEEEAARLEKQHLSHATARAVKKATETPEEEAARLE
ncbi:hypothetical protein SDRG_08077 [Saprolegnia diclina VS20]|uniref:Uncharacterized protein n=1 Tax=Saprolegnia diclina (strain VS20) TaxID=1156394 RepID=T0Q8S8_SAPDV|nr:hypothetical protein SDRG_08077 [Saprolegnia diclina VS20]EQC34304.1 hypothetical protein SDRG_08077 [Saprolegnia diclina VS20]|eukprot:XP_008612166.1 hypothetical protein SDRG_08077 [Saprolegnia diclina VS20]